MGGHRPVSGFDFPARNCRRLPKPLADARLCDTTLIPRDFLLNHDRKGVVLRRPETEFCAGSTAFRDVQLMLIPRHQEVKRLISALWRAGRKGSARVPIRRDEAQYHLLFLKPGNWVGRTPWSARDALVPLFLQIWCLHPPKSRPGGRLRTRGSAPQLMQMSGIGKTSDIVAEACATSCAIGISRTKKSGYSHSIVPGGLCVRS